MKNPNDYDIKKARVVMVDCDLKAPTILALNFILGLFDLNSSNAPYSPFSLSPL